MKKRQKLALEDYSLLRAARKGYMERAINFYSGEIDPL